MRVYYKEYVVLYGRQILVNQLIIETPFNDTMNVYSIGPETCELIEYKDYPERQEWTPLD